MAGASNTVELGVVIEVNSDEINHERLVPGRGSEIHGVEIVRAEAPTALLVPLPNIVELRAERNEDIVWRRRALRFLSDRLNVIHGEGYPVAVRRNRPTASRWRTTDPLRRTAGALRWRLTCAAGLRQTGRRWGRLGNAGSPHYRLLRERSAGRWGR
jgi:hypothetical protein